MQLRKRPWPIGYLHPAQVLNKPVIGISKYNQINAGKETADDTKQI
jgi:hypothetical protein